MRIQLLSDLHLERHPAFEAEPAPDVDLLVLAGDIGSYQPGSRLTEDDFGLGRFSPLRPGSPWPRVMYLPGNHEFDGLDHGRTLLRLRELCTRLGIEWLDREVIELGGVRFVGCTLWCDFDALAEPGAGLTDQLKAREKAFRAANFYLRKNTCLRDGEPMMAEQLRELGLADQVWLREALDRPFAGTTVAVTHFAPSLRSADPRYGLTPGTAGFCSALDDLLPRAQLWMHGHLHCPNDYMVRGEGWACRVVANPLGYFSNGEQQGFRPGFAVDLPDGRAAD